MSYGAHRDRYLDLIHRFLASEVGGAAFTERFFSLWKADRDDQRAQRRSWPEPYDVQLQDALRRGQIGKEEFVRRWRMLWQYSSPDEGDLIEMLDHVFTACDVFVADPALRCNPELDLDEDQLRSEVQGILGRFQSRPVLSK